MTMPLKELVLTENPQVHIYAYEHSETRCDFEEFMEELDEKTQEEFVARLTMLSENGVASLPSKIFHIAGDHVQGYTMYRLAVQRYRLYMGVNSEKVIIIITHGAMKKTQKTDERDKAFFKNCIKRLNREQEK